MKFFGLALLAATLAAAAPAPSRVHDVEVQQGGTRVRRNFFPTHSKGHHHPKPPGFPWPPKWPEPSWPPLPHHSGPPKIPGWPPSPPNWEPPHFEPPHYGGRAQNEERDTVLTAE